jgi:hypothetical protein
MTKVSFGVSVVNTTVANIKRSKQRLATELKLLKTRAKELKLFLNKFSYLNNLDYASVSLNVYSDSASVYMHLRRLDGFKDDLLIKTIVAINDYAMDNGYKVFVENDEYASSLNRDYRFHLSKTDYSWDSYLDISISAYVRDDSPTCKKVKIGEEVSVVDKYMIVCD